MTADHDAHPREAEVPPLEPIASYFGWWDCPRAGVTQVDGQPFYFLSEFSEDIDDYETVYTLWPVPADAVPLELERWAIWCEWRRAFDSGEGPEAIESNRRFVELNDLLRVSRVPPSEPQRARPEWHLDPDRMYNRQTPRHQVRWQANY